MGDQQREQVEKILAMIFELTDEHLLARIIRTATNRKRMAARWRIEEFENDI